MDSNTYQRVFAPQGAHSAILKAATRLAGPKGIVVQEDLSAATAVVGTARELDLDPLPERTFRVFEREGRTWFIGDRPRTVLACVLYWIHHSGRGEAPSLPLQRTSPFRERLILEDFPFSCYAPTGVIFDEELYAENLVALGYTAMECNRFSPKEPREKYWNGFQSTNPSPSRFVWTKWHEGVWDRETVGANAAELRRGLELAEQFDLDPSVTMFLPRPYPERFFGKYPYLRGPKYIHSHLGRGGHPDVFSIDTDHPEGIGFYEAIFREWVKENPEIRNYFFWHGDLGAQFWKDGEGPLKRTRKERILEFHEMLDRIFENHGVNPQVWINPWGMPEQTINALNDELPARVGYVSKDNPAAIHFNGTIRFRMIDSTVTTADIGTIAQSIKELAAKSGRKFCFGQYHDFSEDLDPIMGAPHPLMTYRKLSNLKAFAPEISCTEWGVLSPDLSACRVNQDVVREVTWGAVSTCMEELLPAVFPASIDRGAGAKVSEAWRKVDYALQIWPQYWGMRFQGCGVRQRWLVKPLVPPFMDLPEDYYYHLVEQQLYRYHARDPLHEFMDLDDAQARELGNILSDMVELLLQAEIAFEKAASLAPDHDEWISAQHVSTHWMRIFFTTWKNLFLFHAFAPADRLTKEQHACIADEIENTRRAIQHIAKYPASLIIAHDGGWAQCFGPDLEQDFRRKLEFMQKLTE